MVSTSHMQFLRSGGRPRPPYIRRLSPTLSSSLLCNIITEPLLQYYRAFKIVRPSLYCCTIEALLLHFQVRPEYGVMDE